MPKPCSLRFALVTLVLLLAGACATAVRQGSSSNPSVITREQIDSLVGVQTAYDVISRLHANYLHSRGRVSITTDAEAVPVVFVDAQEYGPIASLRNIPANDIGMIRFYSGPDAVTHFGARYGGGIIQIIPRRE